jgi:hypothetical protein
MRHTLFQDLEHLSGIANFRSPDDQVEVLRHQHVSVHAESVPPAGLFENREKYLLDAIVGEQRFAPVTTAGDEVRAARIVMAFEPRRHGNKLEDRDERLSDHGHR